MEDVTEPLNEMHIEQDPSHNLGFTFQLTDGVGPDKLLTGEGGFVSRATVQSILSIACQCLYGYLRQTGPLSVAVTHSAVGREVEPGYMQYIICGHGTNEIASCGAMNGVCRLNRVPGDIMSIEQVDTDPRTKHSDYVKAGLRTYAGVRMPSLPDCSVCILWLNSHPKPGVVNWAVQRLYEVYPLIEQNITKLVSNIQRRDIETIFDDLKGCVLIEFNVQTILQPFIARVYGDAEGMYGESHQQMEQMRDPFRLIHPDDHAKLAHALRVGAGLHDTLEASNLSPFYLRCRNTESPVEEPYNVPMRAGEVLRKLNNGTVLMLMRDMREEVARIEADRIRAHAVSRADTLKDLVRYVYHETRGPINAMTLALDDHKVGDTLEQDLYDVLYSAGQLTLQIVNDLRDLDHIEQGLLKMDLNVSMGLSELVRQSILLNTTVAHHSNVTLRSALEDINVPVSFDSQRLHQLMNGLIIDAIESASSSTDKSAVLVATYAVGSRVHIAVSDSGHTISEENASLLLSRTLVEFLQSGAGKLKSQTRRGGLRFLIAKEIISKHGGSMEISPSAQLGGLKIEFSLPILSPGPSSVVPSDSDRSSPVISSTDTEMFMNGEVEVTDSEGGISASMAECSDTCSQGYSSQDSMAGSPAQFRRWKDAQEPFRGDSSGSDADASSQSPPFLRREPMRITSTEGVRLLIVEDLVMSQKLLKKYFDKQGYICDVASDGNEAVSKVLAQQREGIMFDVIMMDVEMPIMNGFDATKMIRVLHQDSTLIVGLTGNCMENDYQKLVECGADLVLTKPFNKVLKSQFEKEVLEHMNRRAEKTRSHSTPSSPTMEPIQTSHITASTYTAASSLGRQVMVDMDEGSIDQDTTPSPTTL